MPIPYTRPLSLSIQTALFKIATSKRSKEVGHVASVGKAQMPKDGVPL